MLDRESLAGGRDPLPTTALELDQPHVENSSSVKASNWRTVVEEVIYSPVHVWRYYVRLCQTFGFRYVAMVALVYGVNQGVGEGLFGTATQYFLSDKPPKGLGLEASRIASIDGFASVPWQIKSVYGMLSDSFPIYDLHRTPYIIFAGSVGVFAWGGLWLWPFLSSGLAGFFLFFGNLSIASPDVMIDASVAENSKRHPRFASDLQTLCWSSFGIGQILSSASSGWLVDSPWCGSRGLFGITVFTSLAILLPAWRGWLGEIPASVKALQMNSEGESDEDEGALQRHSSQGFAQDSSLANESFSLRRMWWTCREYFTDPLAGPLYRLSIVILVVSISMGLIANNEGNALIFIMAVVTAVVISFAVYWYERDISLRLAKASIYIFISGAVQPSSSLMFMWSKQDKENCAPERQRPCFSPEFLSALSVLGFFVFVAGTALYNRYFSTWSYRKIWASTQVLLTVFSFSDWVFVQRWNLTLGIPDKAFMLGAEVLVDLVYRLNTMPLFVLAAATCPDGLEATLFAMNMGLSNFGKTLGEYAGIGLIWALGGIKRPEFENLSTFIAIRSVCHLLPILFIPFLVPEGSPSGEEPGSTERRSSTSSTAEFQPLVPS